MKRSAFLKAVLGPAGSAAEVAQGALWLAWTPLLMSSAPSSTARWPLNFFTEFLSWRDQRAARRPQRGRLPA